MTPKPRPAGRYRPLSRSLQEYGRGIAGGLLFSLPLLYTMEVWWAGFVTQPLRLLLYLSAGFFLLFAYNRYSGLREDASWLEVAFEAVEEMGLGLLVSILVLWLLGQVQTGMPLGEIIGKVVVEGVTAAIGVSVGSAQLGGDGKGQGLRQGDKSRAEESPEALGGQVALASCGAVLFASNVAPTEEIVMIAAEASRWKVLGLALLSLGLCALVLFYSDFRGSNRAHPGDRRDWTTVVSRTVLNYAVALVASAFILWFFGRFADASLSVCLALTVVLGVAAALGASAGRLLLQSQSPEGSQGPQ
jgi:putative integral membrane protein (TIGR02587 family)